MSKRNDFLLIDDILQSLRSINEYTSGMTYDDFVNSKITIDAVIRNFEICGEASNYISDNFKLLHPQIEWRKLADFRNRLIHHYFGVSHDIVWDIIVTEVPAYITFSNPYDLYCVPYVVIIPAATLFLADYYYEYRNSK